MGVGIAVGGLTIVLSILLYNLSVRLLTKLYKPVGKLAKAMKNALVNTFRRLKGACAK